jgi:RNA polymerase sigma factor (TIGR02999 family)
MAPQASDQSNQTTECFRITPRMLEAAKERAQRSSVCLRLVECLPVPDESTDITAILKAIRAGEAQAFEQLMPLVYETLKRIAHWQLRTGAILNTTELVHEAYLKLAPAEAPDWQGRSHFFGIAARAMRQILIDLARRQHTDVQCRARMSARLGSDAELVDAPLDELIALNDALERLGRISERLKEIVEYRYFAGMSEMDIARVLGVSTRTVQRDWLKARLWLHHELYPGHPPES